MNLTPTEREVLVSLSREHGDGDNIQTNLADSTGRSSRSVSRAVERLLDRGLVRNKGRGVYRLSEEGREVADRLDRLDDALGSS